MLPSVHVTIGLASEIASGLQNLSYEVLMWLSVWSKMQMICIWFSWCHCHPIISCFIKIQKIDLSGTGIPRLSWIGLVIKLV